MTKTRASIGVLGLALLGAATGRAQEVFPQRAEPILSPGKSVAGEDSADAIILNPANLGYQPGGELRWTGVRCTDTQKVGCGHAFGLATPLLWGLGTGLRVDYVSPPWTVGFPFNGFDYTWVTWAVGLRLSDSLAVGFSLQRSYSSNSYTDGLFGITSAITYRPSGHLGFAAVANDWNGPSSKVLPISNLPVMDPSYVVAMDFRPTASSALDIGLEATWLEGSDEVLPKAIVAIDLPGFGRARGDIQVAHLPNDERRSFVGTAGLELSIGQASLGGGILAGSGLGSNSSIGEYGTASIHGFRNTSTLPRAARAVWIRIEDTPGTRAHVALLRRLWWLSEQRDVKAVTLLLRAEPASSFAHAEELADAIRVLRSRGKKVLCSVEDAGSRSLYVCANADRTVANPGGTVHYAGLSTQYFYLAGLLDKLGIKGEFVRVSGHKSAPEQFTNTQAGDVARADHEDFLRETEAVFTKDVSNGRHLSAQQVRDAATRGVALPDEARAAGLVDELAFDDQIEHVTESMVGGDVRYERYVDDNDAPTVFGPQNKLAVLYIDGDIVDGRSQHVPLVDMKLAGSYSIVDTIKDINDDPTIRAVVLRVESPGGSTTASDVMWRALTELAKHKPLIVSMGSVAASGGYYVSAPGRIIFAEPLTTTGSIGVFYGKADVSELLRKIGVNVETYKTAPHADATSLFRPFTEDERTRVKALVDHTYDLFLSRVSESRHMSKESIDAVAQGRVWTGQEAFEHHLVDRLGGMREAMAAALSAGGLPDDAPVVELPRVQHGLLDTALELAGIEDRAAPFLSLRALPAEIKETARAIAPMAVHANGGPLARIEWVDLDETSGDEDDE